MPGWKEKLEGIDTSQESFCMCFACGQENPIGLRLAFTQREDEATSEFIIGDAFQGWNGFVHGGILCTVLDEAMAYAHFPRIKAVTAKAEVRFRQPAPVGVPMVVSAKLVRKTRKLLTVTAVISLKDGTIIAEATAQSYVVDSY